MTANPPADLVPAPGDRNLQYITNGDAIVRHHKVISARSEFGNFGLLTTMQQIQEQLNRIETRVNVTGARVERIEERVNVTDARVERIEERVNVTDARAEANSARFINYLQFADNTPFAVVVKYTPGHPWVGAPEVDNVQFAPEYAINTPPPANLVPLTSEELQEMNDGDLATIRRRLRGAFWFYNDQRLALPANANRAACCRIIQALDHFLKYP